MSLPLITPERIRDWGVNDPDAPHRLPELIRRLIQTSHQAITRLEMSAGKQVSQGGYDGIVEAGPYLGAGRRFVPVGCSVWELGVQGDPLKKFKKDYEERTSEQAPPINRAETTFVLVTHHILTPKLRDWAEERRRDPAFPWRRLEIYGAEELRSWLEAAPAVAAWFGATCLGLPSALMSLEGALEHLKARTPQRIPPHILLPERDAEAAAVRRWAEAALDEPRGRTLTLQASSEEEALAFVCAALDDDRFINPRREAFHAQTLIARTREAWEYVLSEHPGARLLLLPMPGVAPRTPGERRVHALLPVEPPAEAEICLSPMSIGAFAGALVHKAGLSVGDANTYAAQSNTTWTGLLSALHPTTPTWLPASPPDALIYALLLGSWCEDHSADRKLLSDLTQQSFEEAAAVLEPLTHGADPPLHRAAPETFTPPWWRWVRRRQAWEQMQRHLTQHHVDTFIRLAGEALRVPSAANLDTPHAMLERFKRGERFEEVISPPLREGILEAFTWLASTHTDAIRAQARKLLTASPQVAIWLTQRRHLDTLAALDGETFIQQAMRFTERSDARRDELLDQASFLDALSDIGQHTPTRRAQVIQLLVQLNTPHATRRLMELLHTLPSDVQRRALTALEQRDAEAAWSLRLRLIQNPRLTLHALSDDTRAEDERRLRWRSGWEALSAHAQEAIRQAQQQPRRWPELLEEAWRLYDLGQEAALLEALSATQLPQEDEAQRDALALGLRRCIRRLQRELGWSGEGAPPEHRAAPLLQHLLDLYRGLAPGEFAADWHVPPAWFFTRDAPEAPILSLQAGRLSYKDRVAHQERALARLAARPDALQALQHLLSQVDGVHHRDIFFFVTQRFNAEQINEALQASWTPEQLAHLLAGIARRPDPTQLDEPCLARHLSTLSEDLRAEVLPHLPLLPASLDALEALPDEPGRRAWAQLAYRTLDEVLAARVVRRLIKLDLPLEALEHLQPLLSEAPLSAALSTLELHTLLEHSAAALQRATHNARQASRAETLRTLHETLIRRADHDRTRLLTAERRFANLITDVLLPPRQLLSFDMLAQDASSYVELLLSDESGAYALLRAWRRWLRRSSASIPNLSAWLKAIMQSLARTPEEEHRQLGWFIGQTLAHLPADPGEELWPPLALREALEEELPLKDELLRGFYGPDAGGRHPDSPEVHNVALGGEEAQREVERRRSWLEALEWPWPTAAEAVRMSLSYWADEVKRRDRDAELLRQRRFYSLTEGQEGHLTFKQAQAAGVAAEIPKLLEAGALERVGPGVYRLKSVAPAEEAHLLALWLQFEQEGVFSHGTALGFLDLSTFEPSQVELTLPRAWEARKVRWPPGTILHYEDIPPGEVTWRGNIPITTPARTLEDCASVPIAPDLLEQAVKEGLRRGRFTRDEIPKTLAYLAPYRREVG